MYTRTFVAAIYYLDPLIMKDLTLLNKIIDTHFDQHPELDRIPVKELMPQFVKAGIFEKDAKMGLPLRRLLRALDRNDELHLIPSVVAERTEKNTSWFFGRSQTAAAEAASE